MERGRLNGRGGVSLGALIKISFIVIHIHVIYTVESSYYAIP